MSEQQETRYRPVEIELGGQQYTMRLTWGAMRRIRDKTDGRVNFFRGGLADAENDDLPLILWACISHRGEGGDPDIALESVEDMVEVDRMAEMMNAVFGMFGMDLEQAAKIAGEITERAEDTDADPLGETPTPTPSSSSGATPGPFSGSPPPSSGSSRRGNTQHSGGHTTEPSTDGIIAPV